MDAASDKPPSNVRVRLRDFRNPQFSRGRSFVVELAWMSVSALFVRSWIPGSAHRRILLRLFGAGIGQGVIVKPGVRVKFPWRLKVGDDSWIGEDAWIDNLAMVEIGSDCCISQGVYLCTGDHDWSKPTFDLKTGAIRIEDQAWIAAKAVVRPGVSVGSGAVLTLGSVATKDLAAWKVYQGNPAAAIGDRRLG